MKRILVVGPAWVGDMVMAQALFMAIKAREPEALIDVLAPEWSLPLLGRMPEVSSAIPLPIGHGALALRGRWRIGRELRGRYDQALVLPRSLKSALIPWFARVPRRTGFLGEFRYGLINDRRPLDRLLLRQTIQRFVALGQSAHTPSPPPVQPPRLTVQRENQERLRRELALPAEPPAVALMPGAEYGPAKRWPPAHFGAIAARLVRAGYQVWLIGSERDRPVAEEVRRHAGVPVTNLCGRTRLEDAIDLLALARAAVTNDSGLMHVAAAVDRPLVALFGSSTPDYTPPQSGRAVVLYDRIACSPCFKRSCPRGHTRCLMLIEPERVWAALQPILATAP